MYSKKQKQEIDAVIPVFERYIKDSRYLDLVWSEKAGYLLLRLNPPFDGLAQEPDLIRDAAQLCRLIFEEIAMDVLEMTGNEHGMDDADALEQAEIRRRAAPFLQKLPAHLRPLL